MRHVLCSGDVIVNDLDYDPYKYHWIGSSADFSVSSHFLALCI